MSELERSETGALTESPTLLPTHPEQGGAGAASPTRTTEPKEPVPGAGEPTSNGATDNSATRNETAGRTTAPSAPPKRRRPRLRGGRGRGKGGSGSAPTETEGGGRPKRTEAAVRYVDAGAQLGGVDVDGTALLESLDSVTLARRSGSHRKGRPAGRYLMVVH